MLQINMDDVWNILNSCKPYLIFFGIVFILGVIILLACKKLKKSKRKFIRSQAGIAILLAFVITVNLICFIPMSSLITLATGRGTINESTSNAAAELCKAIAEEGIVLLKNEDNFLPLNNEKNLNVFG